MQRCRPREALGVCTRRSCTISRATIPKRAGTMGKGAAMKYAGITGWGKCMPPAILDNAGLATFLETTDDWITSRTGIKERRISHVPMTTLSHVAAARAVACAGIDPLDLDLVVMGSCSTDEHVPNTASGVQSLLGASNAAAMDINTACTSFLYGLSTATAMVGAGVVLNSLVTGAACIRA